MSILATTQAVIDWGRLFVPDPKTRINTVRNEELGRTATPSTERETFYIKNQALNDVTLYIDPYLFATVASLGAATADSRSFKFNPTLQSCIFPMSSDPSIWPGQFKPVLANYDYTERLPYAYSDTELVTFLPAAISYLNNTYGYGYTYAGTISTFLPAYANTNEKQILAMGLSVIVRKSFVAEQMRKGFGVSFRGPMAAINSAEQLRQYEKDTKALEQSIADSKDRDNINSAGGGVDLYTENVI